MDALFGLEKCCKLAQIVRSKLLVNMWAWFWRTHGCLGHRLGVKNYPYWHWLHIYILYTRYILIGIRSLIMKCELQYRKLLCDKWDAIHFCLWFIHFPVNLRDCIFVYRSHLHILLDQSVNVGFRFFAAYQSAARRCTNTPMLLGQHHVNLE